MVGPSDCILTGLFNCSYLTVKYTSEYASVYFRGEPTLFWGEFTITKLSEGTSILQEQGLHLDTVLDIHFHAIYLSDPGLYFDLFSLGNHCKKDEVSVFLTKS